jgi:hypothetical protein
MMLLGALVGFLFLVWFAGEESAVGSSVVALVIWAALRVLHLA